MFKIQDIEKYINDPILETIFRGREEELYNEDENRDIIKIKEEYPVNYDKLLITIKNLPPHFHNTREGIIEALENYSMRESSIKAYDNEKFYKVGFCDGIRIVLESIKKDNSKWVLYLLLFIKFNIKNICWNIKNFCKCK